MPLRLPGKYSLEETGKLFDRKRIGDGTEISQETMERHIREESPASRMLLTPAVREHAALLATQFDRIDESHREAAGKLAEWIAQNYQPGKPLPIIAVCTGNSRRSQLSATMGNIAASYYGLPDVRFYSGGTTPSAFNPRTITALREIGVVVKATDKEAPRGSANTANPIYSVVWGKGLETVEFSKKYSDAANPQSGFAAMMVCSEANEACPTVKGASERIPVPYDDPKTYDGAAFEAAKYAERRDDIGRFMLNVLLQARALRVANPKNR